MSSRISILGMGWVTPLGCDLDDVWARMMSGHVAEPKPLANPETGRIHHYAAVPPKLVEHLGRNPRLRRASPISYFSVAAGLAALQHAGVTVDAAFSAGTAVIFAVSSGSVVYTRKFYEGVVKNGANTASPMLFPETVYNAPASHLAAQLGIDGYSYTVVGDNSVGLAALKLAEQLLLAGEVDHCLVVGAEEIDWVLCEAYRDWRFAGSAAPPIPYAKHPTGALLAEGAGAVLLSRNSGLAAVAKIHDGCSFDSRTEAAVAARQVIRELHAGGESDCVVASANGSWTDAAEAIALSSARLICPKIALGEALGASALWQVISGVLALRKGELPSLAIVGENAPTGIVREPRRTLTLTSATVLATGLNQQASGLVLRKVS